MNMNRAFALFLFLTASAALFGAGACGSDVRSGFDDDGGGAEAGLGEAGPLDGLKSITLTPTSASLIAGDMPTTQAFTASGTFNDGTSRDVTSLVVWSAGPGELLTTAGATVATAGIGGDGTMTATAGTVSASAPVNVKLIKTILAPGALPGSDTKFGGATDATFVSNVVYPLAGALFPPNLQPMEIQWAPPAGATIFDLHLVGDVMDLHIYTPCNVIGATGGCGLVTDVANWTTITSTLQGRSAAVLTVRAADAAGTKVGVSAPSPIRFSLGRVEGGLYYFNTRSTMADDGGPSAAGIFRYDFDTAKVEPFFTQQQCAGCHALSRDGTKMIAAICTDARGCGRPLQVAVVDVATKTFITPPMPAGDSDTHTWSPDNKYYVTTPSCGTIAADGTCASGSNGVMSLIDATTNTLVGPVGAGAGAMFPSFSNDGKHLVYARGNPYNGPLGLTNAGLFSVGFTAPTWGTEAPLLSIPANNVFHPSYSPDDAWVVFTQSFCAPGDPADACDSYNDPSARIGVVSAAGGAPIDLALANGTGKLTNSWPKWSPFQNAYKDGNVYWLTMSSSREYGFRTRDGANAPTGVRQLWLVGFDAAKAKAGMDPSFAPVWLPFQETIGSNHIGQWTTKIIPVVH